MMDALRFIKVLIISIVTLSACSKPPTTVIIVKPTVTSGTPSPRPSSTLTPTLIPSSTSPPTIKPFGTKIARTTLDQESSVFIPVDILLINETVITDLSPDLVIIDLTADTEKRIEEK